MSSLTSTINGDEDVLMSDTTTEHGAAAGDPAADQQAERVPYRYTAQMAGEIEAFWQDRWEKEGKRGGLMRFARIVTEYRDAEGNLIAEQRSVVVETARPPKKDSAE